MCVYGSKKATCGVFDVETPRSNVPIPREPGGETIEINMGGDTPNLNTLRHLALKRNKKRLGQYMVRVASSKPMPPWSAGTLSDAERLYLFHRRGGKCVQCECDMRFIWNAGDDCFTVDHIFPKSKRPNDVRVTWALDNFQAMCSRCNRDAGDRDVVRGLKKQLSRHDSITEALGLEAIDVGVEAVVEAHSP